jgi:hypothetical protein
MNNYSTDYLTGNVTCNNCQCSFYPNIKSDLDFHARYHKFFINSVHTNNLLSDNVIFVSDSFKLLVVTSDSTMAQRNRAERIARRVHAGTFYDILSFYATPFDNKIVQLAFIGVISQQAISFLVMREINKSIKISWDEFSQDNPFLIEIPAILEKRWCLDMIWTLDKYRGHGYAKLTIEQALKYFNKPICEIAWLQPFTENGKLLAKSLTPNEIFIPD